MRYVRETNETLTTAFQTSITQLFYVVSYYIILDKRQQQEYEKLRHELRLKSKLR